jgi:hypothetical protein
MFCVAVDQAGNTIVGASPSQAQIEAQLLHEITPRRKVTINNLLRSDGYTLSFNAPAPGVARISWYTARRNATGRLTRTLLASGHHTFPAAVGAKIKLELTHHGLSVLEHASRLRLTSTGTFKPAGRSVVTAISRFTIGR